MAKEKGKKIIEKGKKIGHSNAKMKKVKSPVASSTEAIVPDAPAPFSEVTDASVYIPETKSNVAASPEHLSGFIFMCNSSTKLECYQYRVFGLPYGAKGVVERIKPGAKLFLYDFELKLLYGVYEATSSGKLHLEPAAFRGRFPAQVNFKIFKECFPLPEIILRSVIKENYTGSKFNQELSGQLVENLISTFLPLHESFSQPGPHTLAYASLSLSTRQLAGENPLRLTGRLPAMEGPHLSWMHHTLMPALGEHQPVSKGPWQHGYHQRPAAYAENIKFSLHRQSFPGISVTVGVQDPLYSRYNMAPPQYGTSVMQPQAQALLPPSFHQSASKGQALYGDNGSPYNSYTEGSAHYTASTLQPHGSNVCAYNPSLVGSAQYVPSALQPQVSPLAGTSHQSPCQGQALQGDNVSPYNPPVVGSAQYVPSAPQPQVLPAGISHRSPTQGQLLYGDNNVTAYSSYSVVSAQCVPSALQPQVLQAGMSQQSLTQGQVLYGDHMSAYNPQLAVSAQFAASEPYVPPAGVPQASAPILPYNSYTAASQLGR